MARLKLVDNKTRGNREVPAHRASATEGEAAIRLLEEQGYPIKRIANGQAEASCPMHQGPGAIEPRKATAFYINVSNSKYYCQSASCGERGNLKTLERFFGIGEDESFATQFISREEQLREYEQALTPELRGPFTAHGLSEVTIERFRLGFQPAHFTDNGTRVAARYVIPYLESRRPRWFRYYAPDLRTRDADGDVEPGQSDYDARWKYTWEEGAQAALFNAQDAMGDKDGRVILCEGEMKAMMLVQMGYAAVAVPGAAQWKDEFQAAFTHARHIVICYDNDNPIHHKYDKPERLCQRCSGKGLDRCAGHNPGQDAARARLTQLGWRAKNVLLPLPDRDAPKTDVNDFFIRDGRSNADFALLATGKRTTPFKVLSFAEISASPPVEAAFLIEQGILPKAGRLLVAGKPKSGKSILVDNMALSLAAGIPFLDTFEVSHPMRTMLLDREMSKWSLFSRINALTDDRPAYKKAHENLLIDHDFLLRFDQPHAFESLYQLIDENGVEVCILDTAYKFFAGDIESSKSLMKGFEVIDKVIQKTECSFVLTHHLRKGQAAKGKENSDIADPDAVAGSFLWTGWPNATILLNFLNRRVEDPFNAICTFTAFRDHAAPEPLALYRNRESISYSAITPYSHDETTTQQRSAAEHGKPTTESVGRLLLELCPVPENDFLHMTAAHFGVSVANVKPYYLDAVSSGHFEKTKSRPVIVKYRYAEETETWEHEHHLPERPLRPVAVGASIELDDDPGLFDAAVLT